MSILQANLDAKDIELEAMRTRHETQLNQLTTENHRLNRLLNSLSSEEQELREKMHSMDKAHKHKLEKLRKAATEANERSIYYENMAVELKDKCVDNVQSSAKDSELHQLQVQKYRSEVDKTTKMYESKLELMEKKHRSQLQVVEAELQLERIHRQEAQEKLKTSADLVNRAQEIQTLERENVSLQAATRQYQREIEKLERMTQNTLVQREEIDQLKQQLLASQNHCAELARLKAEHDYTDQENQHWKKTLTDMMTANHSTKGREERTQIHR